MSDENNKSDDSIVHVYDDDIREQDNRLPRWWQYSLYLAILFGIAYWYGEHQLGAWPSQSEKYEQEMAAARLEELRRGGDTISAETLVAMSKSPATVDEGKALFVSTCGACHRADGGGAIGPNLTDDYWLHGGKPEDIFKCVHDGVPSKGMPTWGPQLGKEKVAAVVAYVLTLKGTNVPGGKAPQGEKEL